MEPPKESISDYLPYLTALTESLDKEQLETLVKACSVQHYKKGEHIYDYGEVPEYMFCIIRGKVKVYKEGIGFRQQIIRVIRPVEYFGFRASFAGECYITDAVTFEESTLIKIRLSTIKCLILENTSLCWHFIKILCGELGKSDMRTVNLTQKHIRARLAESLLILKDRYGLKNDGKTLNIIISREDLANMSNMTTSNAIRTLSLFVQEGCVQVDGKTIRIIDESSLEKISKMG